MSNGAKIALGAGAAFLVLWWLTPLSFFWSLLILLGVPVVAYLMLDESQRRRLRSSFGRKQIGR
jgi:membrane protein implicated in regulation of membrane protease activity